MSDVIRVKHLNKSFNDLTVVNNLSFTVPQGVVYGFLGQNGAGKSTTIRMLLTLVEPSSGTIEIFGQDLVRHRKQILRRTGAIIERPDLYKYLTALENMRLFCRLSGVKKNDRVLIDQLDKVGLADRADSKVKTYSQGMKQRLGIAVALVHDPELVILDEPTNGLDPQGIADIRKMILHLSHDLGKTVFVSSHLLNEMQMTADSMLIINKGKKVAEGKVQELLDPADTIVDLQTESIRHAMEKITATQWSSFITLSQGNVISFRMHQNMIPALARDLVAADIPILSLHARHSLEDFFLSITSSDVDTRKN